MNATDRARVAGEIVLHPVALAGLALLVLNDHVLKGAAPAWLTGKLSDVAGLVLLPFLALALLDVVRRRQPPGVRAAAVAAAATALAFSAVKLVEPLRSAAAVAGGWLRAPLDALTSLATGTRTTVGGPVVIVADPTDVVAVLACAAVVLVVRRTTRLAQQSAASTACSAAASASVEGTSDVVTIVAARPSSIAPPRLENPGMSPPCPQATTPQLSCVLMSPSP